MEDAAGVDLYQLRSMLSASSRDDGVNPKHEMMVWRTKTLVRPRRSTHVECMSVGVIVCARVRARMCQWVCKWRGNLRSECLARSGEMTSPRRKSRTIKMGECCQEEGGAGNKARAIREEERSRRQAGGGQGDEWDPIGLWWGRPDPTTSDWRVQGNPGDDFFLFFPQQSFPNFFSPTLLKLKKLTK